MGSSWRRAILLRLFLLGAGTVALGLLLAETRYYVLSTLFCGLLVLLVLDFLRLSRSADRDLVRVIDGIGYGDLADWPLKVGRQNADQPIVRAFTQALDRLRSRSAVAEGERARLLAVVEHAPVPLLMLEADGRIELLNRAARRLFDGVVMTRRAELIALAPDFEFILDTPMTRRLVRLSLPRGPQRCLVSVAGSISTGRRSAILSLQNIEGELEASELRAWEELVRVLAHEIMNSLTPVASLAQTASLLVEDLRMAAEPATALAELDEAVDAIHRRSAGLMRFVESYRRFAEPPVPAKCAVPVAELFERAHRLHGTALAACGAVLEIGIDPPTLVVQADPDLLDQALVNLIKNAIEAVERSAEKRIRLAAGLDSQGRVVLTVTDSGPGLSPMLAEQIFVPFFTTKAKGSGIGLPIVRQIMLAHGGTIEAIAESGGARFRMRF